RFAESYGGEGVITLAAKAAGEDAFRKEAPKHRFLHAATHGFFAPTSVRSALSQPAREAELGQALKAGSMAVSFPGLLSGLVLAGANQPGAGGNDGILTAQEIETIDLRNMELVVLSACETGLGESAGGE